MELILIPMLEPILNPLWTLLCVGSKSDLGHFRAVPW
jgi:hypothetical protein